jgi:hypothetical protein
MKPKHTPGPWEYNPKRSQPELQLYRVTTTKNTAATFLTSSEADARLIAAAPELLWALKYAEGVMSETNPNGPKQSNALRQAIEYARMYIAKAEGKE